MFIPHIQYDRESYDQDSRSSRVSLSCSSNLASLLCSLEQCEDPLVIEGRMLFSLAAWLISGKDSQSRMFQTGSPVYSFNPGENTLTQHITQPE